MSENRAKQGKMRRKYVATDGKTRGSKRNMMVARGNKWMLLENFNFITF